MDGVLQRLLVLPAHRLLLLDRRDVDGGDHQAAFGRPPFGDLQPAAVVQLDFAHALADRGRMLPADGQLGDAHHALTRGARLQDARLQGEESAEVLIAQQQPPQPIPKHEGFRDAVDGVAQTVLGGLGAGLGQAFLGDVQRHPDDPAITFVGGIQPLAAGVDPGGAAMAVRHPERDVEGAIGLGRLQRLAHALAVIGGDPVQHLGAIDHPSPAPAQDRTRDVRHEDAVGLEVPLPDAAARRLDRQPETLLGVGIGLLGMHRLAVLDHQQHGEQRPDGQGSEDVDQIGQQLAWPRPRGLARLSDQLHQRSIADALHRQPHRRAVGQLALGLAARHIGRGDLQRLLERGRISRPAGRGDGHRGAVWRGDGLDLGADVFAQQRGGVSGGDDLDRPPGPRCADGRVEPVVRAADPNSLARGPGGLGRLDQVRALGGAAAGQHTVLIDHRGGRDRGRAGLDHQLGGVDRVGRITIGLLARGDQGGLERGQASLGPGASQRRLLGQLGA